MPLVRWYVLHLLQAIILVVQGLVPMPFVQQARILLAAALCAQIAVPVTCVRLVQRVRPLWRVHVPLEGIVVVPPCGYIRIALKVPMVSLLQASH